MKRTKLPTLQSMLFFYDQLLRNIHRSFAEISSNLFTITEISRKGILDNTSNLEDDINSLITELSKIEFSQKLSQLAGNARTICSGNNHEEGDTLIPYLLSVVPVQQNKAVVYATDTDIFVLLMRFRGRLPFQQIFLKTSFDECIDLDNSQVSWREKSNCIALPSWN